MPKVSTFERLRTEFSSRLSDLAVARKNLLDYAGRLLITCLHCKRRSRLGAWSFVQAHYSSVNKSPDWQLLHTKNCALICPKCGDMDNIGHYKEVEKLDALIDQLGSYFDSIFAKRFDRYNSAEPLLRIDKK